MRPFTLAEYNQLDRTELERINHQEYGWDRGIGGDEELEDEADEALAY